MDLFMVGSAMFYLAVFAVLLREAWWEVYPPYDRDADTWDGKVDL